MHRFLKHNRLTTIPRKMKDREMVFDYLCNKLGALGKENFTEAEINSALKEVFDDYATLRRFLVDFGYIERDPYGKNYRLKVKEDRDGK